MSEMNEKQGRVSEGRRWAAQTEAHDLADELGLRLPISRTDTVIPASEGELWGALLMALREAHRLAHLPSERTRSIKRASSETQPRARAYAIAGVIITELTLISEAAEEIARVNTGSRVLNQRLRVTAKNVKSAVANSLSLARRSRAAIEGERALESAEAVQEDASFHAVRRRLFGDMKD